FSQNVPLAIKKIKEAIATGNTTMQHVEESVKRILIAKYRAGLAAPVRIEESGVTAALNKEMESVWKQVAQSAITVVQDKNNIVGNLKSGNTVAYVALGNSSDRKSVV